MKTPTKAEEILGKYLFQNECNFHFQIREIVLNYTSDAKVINPKILKNKKVSQADNSAHETSGKPDEFQLKDD